MSIPWLHLLDGTAVLGELRLRGCGRARLETAGNSSTEKLDTLVLKKPLFAEDW
jgi:hypothetical protein